jgi:hypothetical protein
MIFIYYWKNMEGLVDTLSSRPRREHPFNAHNGIVTKTSENFITSICCNAEFDGRKFDTRPNLIAKATDLIVTKNENTPSVLSVSYQVIIIFVHLIFIFFNVYVYSYVTNFTKS